MKPTHLSDDGAPRMVDVGSKPVTARRAVAEATVRMRPEVLGTLVDAGGPKGDAFVTARLAGIGAAKRTAELIPLCHPLPLDRVDVELTPDAAAGTVTIRAEVAATARTGVEMEALTAASVAALTLYDMAKALQRDIVIESVRLLEKSGGRSGDSPRVPRSRRRRMRRSSSPARTVRRRGSVRMPQARLWSTRSVPLASTSRRRRSSSATTRPRSPRCSRASPMRTIGSS